MAIPFKDFEPTVPLPPMYDPRFAAQLEEAARSPFRARPAEVDAGRVPDLPSVHSFVTPSPEQNLTDLGLKLMGVAIPGAALGRAGGIAAASPRTPWRGSPEVDGVIGRGSRSASAGSGATSFAGANDRVSVDRTGAARPQVAGNAPGWQPGSGIAGPSRPTSVSPVARTTVGKSPPGTGGRPSATKVDARATGDVLAHPAARLGLGILGIHRFIERVADTLASNHRNDPETFSRLWRQVQDYFVTAAPHGAKDATRNTCIECEKGKIEKLTRDRNAAVSEYVDGHMDWYSGLAAGPSATRIQSTVGVASKSPAPDELPAPDKNKHAHSALIASRSKQKASKTRQFRVGEILDPKDIPEVPIG